MSIKSRLKRIEGKLPDEKKAAEKVQATLEEFLFMDYEEFRTAYVEWLFAAYYEQHEKAAEWKNKRNHLTNTLQPIMQPSECDKDALQQLFVSKIVDWMEEHELEPEDIDYGKLRCIE
ncbi:hypothetical protein [Peribacillus sp. NPDC060253]|uniref:hypothetical protein n=1 Tax=Peribacillus sp. NPDC060253 TaxID=3347084 RepID=UPI0036639023